MALTDNLISYWKMEGNSNDSVDSNNGTDTSITYGTSYGKIAQGALFNGTTSKISLPTSTNISGDFTVSMWIKPPNAGYSGQLFTDWNTSTKNIYIQVDANNLLAFYRGDGTTGQDSALTTATPLTGGTWYFVVFTQSGTTKNIYINAGTPSTQTTTNTGGVTGNIDTLGQTITGDPALNGSMDEVGLWSRALTSTEITTLYNSGNGLTLPLGMQINISDTWKLVSGVQVNIGDTWKTVTKVQINISDTWKTIF